VRRIILFLVSTLAGIIVLFSYRTSWGPAPLARPVAHGVHGPGIVPGTGGPTPPAGPTPSPGASPDPSQKAGKSNATMTVNGSVADTIWGPVQVQVVITQGRISDVQAIVYPNGNNRDFEINSYALPQLHDQVIAAQSANIDGVSGATVTSQGYIESLQAALDYAHFQ
jgi:uncharacterized protein with FMN-binding domain